MTDLLNQALALRAFVSDSTLLDWLDLEQLLPERPCHIETAVLRRHWHCHQSTVSRRLGRLWEAGLLDYRAGSGLYQIRRLGPAYHPDPLQRSRSGPVVHPLTPLCD
jgi:hypothetical protein